MKAVKAYAVAINHKEWPKSKCAELFQRGSFAAGKGKKTKTFAGRLIPAIPKANVQACREKKNTRLNAYLAEGRLWGDNFVKAAERWLNKIATHGRHNG